MDALTLCCLNHFIVSNEDLSSNVRMCNRQFQWEKKVTAECKKGSEKKQNSWLLLLEKNHYGRNSYFPIALWKQH